MGIREQDSGNRLAIYPNPSWDGVFRLSSPLRSSSVITVSDLSGKAVLAARIPAGTGTLDLSGLSKGMYFAEIKTGEELIRRKLVIGE